MAHRHPLRRGARGLSRSRPRSGQPVRSRDRNALDSSLVTPQDPRRPSEPVRTCIGCRKRAAKSELLRVVAGAGTVVPDPGGSAPGRGAHLHPSLACFELAERKRAFGRALRHDAGSGAGALDLAGLREHLTTPVR
ncbi:YlxR family protein [Marmoricola sp. OAE513]|uniref:YlxR family protein n=1 Tax=Marmoricola sp. OAE513 TaxID=2817894 RepID=UPI003397991E